MEGLHPRYTEAPLVRRLIEQGIRDPRVLAAFGRVPRRFFVPEEAQAYAEGDHPLEIGYGQTISQPYIVAAMTEALDLQGSERVLEVGTGSGYQTAILAELLPLSSTIRTVEIVPELSWRAQRGVRAAGGGDNQCRLRGGRLRGRGGAPSAGTPVAPAPPTGAPAP